MEKFNSTDLCASQRTLIQMRYYDNMTTAEIAAVFNVAEEVVVDALKVTKDCVKSVRRAA